MYLFSQNKVVNTILVHKASISSVLKLLNPPTALHESTLHNVIRRMTILRPREQEVLPRWHLSVVLKGLMKSLFAINGTDRHISLELLSYKTAFLVALASGARGSELVALSRASHNFSPPWLQGSNRFPYVWSPNLSTKISDQRSFRNLSSFRELLIYFPMNQSGLWVYTLSSQLIVHKIIPWKNYLCTSTLLLNCLQRTFVDGLLRLFAWHMKIHPSLISQRSRPMTSGESLHPSLSTGILLWKIYVDWSAGSRLTYSSATISETWPIRNYRTSLWWPHGRLSRNLVSYLLITRHLHQCRLTLVVYQWQVGTFE